MTPQRKHLPADLGPAFAVADALQRGVTRSQLERRSLIRTFHGLRARDGHTGIDPAVAYAPRLRQGECFSHTTALRLLGSPIVAPDELHVCVSAPLDRARTRGVRGHRTVAPVVPHLLSSGLPVVPPLLALQQSSALLPIVECVVALDHLVLGGWNRLPLLELDTIRTEVADWNGRGARSLRVALQRARSGAESRMETLTRLLLGAYELDGHFELQVDVGDEAGRIGRFDLVDSQRRLIIEYDGEQHRRDRRQYLRDEARLERVRAAGYRVIRLHWEDVVRHPHRTAVRIAEIMGRDARLVRGGGALLVG